MARCILFILALLIPLQAADAWSDQRAALRKARADQLAVVAKEEAVRGREAAAELGKLITRLGPTPSATAAAQVRVLLGGLRRLDAAAADGLTTRLAALPAGTGDPRAALADLAQVRSRILKPLEDGAQRALQARVPEVAYRFMRHVQAFWPEHPVLHRNLGLTWKDGRWVGPRVVQRMSAGMAWDAELGWIIARDRHKYANGEYFDEQAARWTTLAEADAAHASLADPWKFETEHLAITGTAPLRQLVATANRLEAFYAQIFAAYSAFFGNGENDLKLIFGLRDHEPLRLHIARDKELYQAAVTAAGSDPGWSEGMWIPRANSSFAIAGSDTTIYHEFTHQILYVFTGRNRSPQWLTEAVAQYTEAPDWVDGELVLGRLASNKDIQRHLTAVRGGTHLEVEALMQINDRTAWSGAADPQPQYRAAAALAWWCMEADDRRYRADFVDFLRDSYKGETTGHDLWDYLGLTRSQFLDAYRRWETAAAAEAKPVTRP
jgi:hypothetical protein